jgi:hypothetical protein
VVWKLPSWWPGSTGVVDFGQGRVGEGVWNEVVGEMAILQQLRQMFKSARADPFFQ